VEHSAQSADWQDMAKEGSWLCPTDLDRVRVLDSSERVRRARLTGAAAMGFVTIVAAPWLGWGLFAVFALVAINLATLDLRLQRAKRPERVVAQTLVSTEIAIGIAALITGGATSPVLPWMSVPIGMTAARFRPAVLMAALVTGAILTVIVALAPDPAVAWQHPWLLLATLALEINMVAIATALQGAELQHRSEAILDPLTDLLNRSSLEARFAELSEQAQRNNGSVSLIALDLDAFKQVNDKYGHATGDVVLRDLSYEMRKTLRNFELFYRYGGEEFVVVLPGVSVDQVVVVAERMRSAVERARSAGLAVTISAGVASARGHAVSFRELFEAADDALYDAKRRGRNRVSVAGAIRLASVQDERRELAPA
jgi:diguanylate cyclase (GGDEF)-like protein